MPVAAAQPYASRRPLVMAANMVAASQPLAAEAGLEMLRRGGNAADAAVAAAAAITVLEPTGNGIGSDAFCILWDGGELHGLNASGRSPAALDGTRFEGAEAIPLLGWDAVTVPGAVSAWMELSARFGRLPFAELFRPAIHYAENGFMVGPITASAWKNAEARFTGSAFAEFRRGFLPGGRAPRAGELFCYPDQAATLAEIAASGGESFYRGALAERIAADAARHGAALTASDLAQHRAEWVGTISQGYGGTVLHEIPPNGQGFAALQALGILEQLDAASHPVDSADSLHLQIEAMKLAFADLYAYVADSDHMRVTVRDLLDPSYLERRAALIDRKKAARPRHGVPGPGGTICLSTADSEGMMVSFIQSNYHGFGSGVVVPGTGISLQNRGCGFVLDPDHPNRVAGGKRPLHTIIPAFLMRDGEPFLSYGLMGGPMQAQGHLQMALRVGLYGQNPQAAADAPRWRVLEDSSVAIETGFPPAVLEELAARGHVLHESAPGSDFGFGGAQLIMKADGGYVGGSDPRKDGQAVGF